MKKALLVAAGVSMLFAGCSKIQNKINKMYGSPTPAPVVTATPAPKATENPKAVKAPTPKPGAQTPKPGIMLKK